MQAIQIRAEQGHDEHNLTDRELREIIGVPTGDVAIQTDPPAAKPKPTKPRRARAPKGGATYRLADGSERWYRGGCFVPRDAQRIDATPKTSASERPVSATLAGFLDAWDSAVAIQTPDDDREREAREAFDCLPRVDRRWERVFGPWALA